MKLKLTLLAAAAAAGLWSTAPMAQHTSNPTGTYMDSVPYGTWTGGTTHSPNTMYVYPSGTNYVGPADRAVIYQPTVSRRGMSYGYGPTHSPNPNKAQNSDMRTQIGSDTMYVYPSGTTYMVPTDRTVIYEPTVSRRGMSHSHGPTHTPNPNRVQNNGVPTQN